MKIVESMLMRNNLRSCQDGIGHVRRPGRGEYRAIEMTREIGKGRHGDPGPFCSRVVYPWGKGVEIWAAEHGWL